MIEVGEPINLSEAERVSEIYPMMRSSPYIPLLDRARDQLLGCYQEVEVSTKIGNHAFDGIHGKINGYFETVGSGGR